MLQKMTEHIYYMQGMEKTDRPYLFYIHGKERNVVLDAGNSPAHVKLFYQQLIESDLPLPDLTVVTHWHWDHTFGLSAVKGKTMSSRLTYEKLEQICQWKWTKEEMMRRQRMGEDIEYCNKCIMEEYPKLNEVRVCLPEEIMNNDTVVELGGVTCKFYLRDSTHSRDSVYLYVPEDKVLFVGDADYEDYYDNNYMYDKSRLSDMINFISSFEMDYYVRSHEGIYEPEMMLLSLRNLQKKL